MNSNFDSNGYWTFQNGSGGMYGDLKCCLEGMFEHSHVSEVYGKRQVRGFCLHYGYFAYGSAFICFIPEEGQASVDLYTQADFKSTGGDK